MTLLVTGSAGHLGEGLMRTLRASGRPAVGIDVLPSPFTDEVMSIADRDRVTGVMRGVRAVIHAATLHKPHVVTHPRRAFVEVNVAGTLNLLEAAAAAGAEAFVFTSTTSVFGRALAPKAPGDPAVWVTEDVVPAPKNVYGITKAAAEDLTWLVHDREGLPCLVLRTSRFFPEEDDNAAARAAYDGGNLKVNELLHRRVDLEDVVEAHLLAVERAPDLGFRRYVVSATTPLRPEDARRLRREAPAVVAERAPGYEETYARLGWRMAPAIERVYDNRRARRELGWRPRTDFGAAVARLRAGEAPFSELARAVGSKGYHARRFADGPYPVE